MGTTFEDSIIDRFTDKFIKILDGKLTDHRNKFLNEINLIKKDGESKYVEINNQFAEIQQKLRTNDVKFYETNVKIKEIINRADRMKQA